MITRPFALLALAASSAIASPARAAAAGGQLALAQVDSTPHDRAGAPELERQLALRPRAAELYLALARAYERAGDPARAEATLRRGVREAWEERTMRAALVEFLARAERWGDAATEAEPLATDSASRTTLARLRVNAGVADYRAGNRARARIAWEQALADDPGLVEASVSLGAVLLELGKRDSARVVVRRALAAHPTDVRLLALQARTLDGAEGIAASLEAMRQARRERPGDENVGLELASLLAASGNHLPAMALYDTLVHAPSATDKAFTAAVAFWLDGGQPRAAVSVAELGIQRYPRDAGLYASLGEAHALQSQWPQSVTAYQRAISLSRDREPLELALLDVYLSAADTGNALSLARALARRPASRATLLRAADRIAPPPPWRGSGMGSAADSARREDGAAVAVADEIYDGLLARDSLDLDALEAALGLAEGTGDSARAVTLARHALGADSSGAAAPLVLLRYARPGADSARLLLRRALWRGVDRLQLLELRTAGALSGNVTLRTLARAKPELTRKQREEARLRWALDTAVFHTPWGQAELVQLRLAFPQSALLARYAADVAATDGRDSVALAEYERVLRRNPSDTAAQRARAELLLRAGRVGEAIDAYTRAFDADPTNDSTFHALRALRERQGTLDALLAQLRRLRTRLPDSRPLGEHEVEVLQRLGRLAEAQALATELARAKGGEKKP